MIYQIHTFAWFGEQYNVICCLLLYVLFSSDALIFRTSNTIPFIYASKYKCIRKCYYTTSRSADYGVKYNVEHKSANCCDDKAQEAFHVL